MKNIFTWYDNENNKIRKHTPIQVYLIKTWGYDKEIMKLWACSEFYLNKLCQKKYTNEKLSAYNDKNNNIHNSEAQETRHKYKD